MVSRVDRRLILAGGAGLALLAGLIAAVLLGGGGRDHPQASPASQGGLMVQTGRDDDIALDPRRPLRCFVAGQLIGELPLGECAKRNGVATGSLDVGLDPSGALAAANGAVAQITPLAPAPQPLPVVSPTPPLVEASPVPDEAPGGAQQPCARYAGGAWTALSRPMSLGACLQTLYNGVCERPGGAAYGRWGERTLRLVTGRIETSRDNRSFQPLVDQGPGCTVPVTP